MRNDHPEHPFRFAFGQYHPYASRAFELHAQRAIDQGQVWSDGHAEAFRELHQSFVLTGMGMHRGRTAWPLAVGTGKTQSLVAFALAQSEVAANGGRPLSLLVCIERVEQIRNLINDMVAAGVPRDLIACYHRKTDREVIEEKLIASAAEGDLSRFPFLIATHAFMLKGAQAIETVNTYQDRQRNLIVWDESLIKSQGRHFDLANVGGALGVLRAIVGDSLRESDRDAIDAVTFIGQCLEQLRAEFMRTSAGADAQTVSLPTLSPEDEMRYRVGIVETLKGGDMMRRDSRIGLTQFIEHVQRPVRVVPYIESGRRIGVVRYLTRIPEELSRLIVLDASHTIRLLTSEHDSSIRGTDVNCRVKSFAAVKVHHIVQGAGHDKLDKELPRKDSPTVTKLLEVLKAYPSDEAVIVVTFKPDVHETKLGRGHAALIKRHMQREGIDSNEVLPDGRPRFIFLTWGQHVGVSDYAYAANVLCVGVLRRDILDIASQIVGQRADLLATQAADPAAAHRVVLSEKFHNVVQAAGRGACRTTRNGDAMPMSLTLLCSETFSDEWWQAAMLDVVVAEEVPGAAARASRDSEATLAILKVIEDLPKEVLTISSKTLKLAAGLASMRSDTFSRLLSVVSRELEGWQKTKQGFARITLQFTPEEGYTPAD